MNDRSKQDLDPGLIERCRSGDEAAMRELFRATRQDVQRILFRLVGPSDQLEDLMQNAYLALFKSLSSFRGECSPRTWIYGICIRVAHKYRRLIFRSRRLDERYRLWQAPEKEEAIDGEEEQRRRAALVWRALDRLSIKHREILVLFEMEELDGRELSRLLHLPEGTVWTRLHHARRAFRRAWEEISSC